jgi:hypothetical protein
MYRGFNLKLNLKENEFYYKIGLKLNEDYRVEVKKKLDRQRHFICYGFPRK